MWRSAEVSAATPRHCHEAPGRSLLGPGTDRSAERGPLDRTAEMYIRLGAGKMGLTELIIVPSFPSLVLLLQ